MCDLGFLTIVTDQYHKCAKEFSAALFTPISVTGQWLTRRFVGEG
jgi:hypothetical protein